jgi:hypothetical protein
VNKDENKEQIPKPEKKEKNQKKAKKFWLPIGWEAILQILFLHVSSFMIRPAIFSE